MKCIFFVYIRFISHYSWILLFHSKRVKLWTLEEFQVIIEPWSLLCVVTCFPGNNLFCTIYLFITGTVLIYWPSLWTVKIWNTSLNMSRCYRGETMRWRFQGLLFVSHLLNIGKNLKDSWIYIVLSYGEVRTQLLNAATIFLLNAIYILTKK